MTIDSEVWNRDNDGNMTIELINDGNLRYNVAPAGIASPSRLIRLR